MKKIFTLVAVAAMTLAASAQGIYKYESTEAIKAGTTIDAVPNCTLTFGAEGGADFSKAKASKDVEGFTGYCEGNGENGKLDQGTFYTLKPELDGKITAYVVLNAGKSFYIYEDGVALADYDGITVEKKYYGGYTFDVVGGKAYEVLCTGSKLGFFGFEYTADTTGEGEAGVAGVDAQNADAPIYNMMGVRVDADAKGILIQNGKKFIRK